MLSLDRIDEVEKDHTLKLAANAILKSIKDSRLDNTHTSKRRWVFELIQNAIDTLKLRNNSNLII